MCLLRSYRHCLFKQCCLRNFKDTTSTSAQSIYLTRQPLVLTLSEHTAQSLFYISYMCNRNGYTRNEHRPLELHCTAAARSRVRRLSFCQIVQLDSRCVACMQACIARQCGCSLAILAIGPPRRPRTWQEAGYTILLQVFRGGHSRVCCQ